MAESTTTTTAPPKQQSQRMFLLIGALWIILGIVILSQLPSAVDTIITITWETETETDTAGFNIYRTEAVDGECEGIADDEYVQVNNELINSTGSAIEGDSYEWPDNNNVERNQDYCYQLEDVELTGRTERHDPIYGTAPRQIDRILYIILAPLSLIVGMSLIVSGLRREKKL